MCTCDCNFNTTCKGNTALTCRHLSPFANPDVAQDGCVGPNQDIVTDLRVAVTFFLPSACSSYLGMIHSLQGDNHPSTSQSEC